MVPQGSCSRVPWFCVGIDIYFSAKKNIGVTGLSYFFVNVGNSVQFVVNVGFHMILQIRLPLRRGHGC